MSAASPIVAKTSRVAVPREVEQLLTGSGAGQLTHLLSERTGKTKPFDWRELPQRLDRMGTQFRRTQDGDALRASVDALESHLGMSELSDEYRLGAHVYSAAYAELLLAREAISDGTFDAQRVATRLLEAAAGIKGWQGDRWQPSPSRFPSAP